MSLSNFLSFSSSSGVSSIIAVENSRYDMLMIFESQSSHLRSLNRLAACLFTAKVLIAELEDPVDPQKRADLLLASENLLQEVTRLNQVLSHMTWSELDMRTHPSATDTER